MNQTVRNSSKRPQTRTRRWFKRKVQFSVLCSPRFAIRSSAIEQEGKVWPSQQGLHEPQGERNVPGSGQLICWKAVRGKQRHEVAIRLANSSFPDRLKSGKEEEIRTRVENERFTDSTRYFIRSMTNIRYLRKQTFDCTNEMLVVMIDRISHE